MGTIAGQGVTLIYLRRPRGLRCEQKPCYDGGTTAILLKLRQLTTNGSKDIRDA